MGSLKAPQKQANRAYGAVKTHAEVLISNAVALHRTRRTPFGAEHMPIQCPTNTPSPDSERTCRRLSMRPERMTWSTAVSEYSVIPLALGRHVRGAASRDVRPPAVNVHISTPAALQHALFYFSPTERLD